MDDALTKSQLDKLGRRLRAGDASPDDARLLAHYRRSFLAPYREVVARIARVTSLVPSGRPAKSTTSIVSKLQRSTGTLPQMQDIAGCRLVTQHVSEQDATVIALANEFEGAKVLDRRIKPSSGYRAVHVVVPVSDKLVEIQVRTLLQDRWAQCSEELAFTIDPAIKYGGGPADIATVLRSASSLIEAVEDAFAAKSELDILRVAECGPPERQPLPGAPSFEKLSVFIIDELQRLVTMTQRLHAKGRSTNDFSD